ncbi:hypothetical protein, partial [Streptomyces sp. NPDC001970]
DQRAGSPPCPPPDTASLDPTASPRQPKRNSEVRRCCLLEGELAVAEPKKLRYRLLHAAVRITRGGRRLHLRTLAQPRPGDTS